MFTGVVENILDPLEQGRIQVRFFKIHTDIKKNGVDFGIPTNDLPWATVMTPTTSASINGLGNSPTAIVNGTWVVAFFRDDAMQDPVIIGTIPSKSTKVADTSKGFNDPDGIYPKYVGESDVNRLARNKNIDNTVVKLKQDSRNVGITTATDGTWDEPEIPYNAKYPYNSVYESKSGHIKEYDDTENSERIHEYHKSGTFSEIHPDGSKVLKIVGKSYTIVLNDNHVYIIGDDHEKVTGNKTIEVTKLFIKGVVDIKGNVDILGDVAVTGNISATIKVSAPAVDASTSLKVSSIEMKTHTHLEKGDGNDVGPPKAP